MFREKVLAVLAKIETTSGVDAVPTGAANAVRPVGIPTLNYAYLEPGLRDDVIFGNLGVIDRTAPAGRYGTVEITLEARGAGAAYASGLKPEADAFWRMAGFGVASDFTGGTEFYRYQTLDGGMETATLYLYTGNKLFKMLGCVAAPKFTAEANKRGFLTFAVTGKIASDPTEVAIPALTFNATLPPLFHTSPSSIGAWTEASGDPLVLRRAEIDFAQTVSDRPSAGATDGLIGYIIADRKPRQTMLVEIPTLAAFDAYALSKATGSGLPVSNWQLGVAQYNRVKVVTGRWALEAPGHASDKGINAYNLAGNLVMGTEGVTGREAYIRYD
jgi:hypothetical protein